LPSGITYSTVTRPADRTSPPEERQPTVLTVNGTDESDGRQAFEKRIAELESEVEVCLVKLKTKMNTAHDDKTNLLFSEYVNCKCAMTS
jgi:hypothetical protein